jgi:hypothetical protein
MGRLYNASNLSQSELEPPSRNLATRLCWVEFFSTVFAYKLGIAVVMPSPIQRIAVAIRRERVMHFGCA